MDKRKGIVLAIVLFLIIGLGTFVFANNSEDVADDGRGNNTIKDSSSNDEKDGQSTSTITNDSDSNNEESEGEGGTQGGSLKKPASGSENSQTQTVGESVDEELVQTQSIDYKKLLEELSEKVNNATSKDDLALAEQFRKDNNITEDNIAALEDNAASQTYEDLVAILTDTDKPSVTPEGLDNSYNKDNVSVAISDKTEVNYTITMINAQGKEVEVTEDLNNLTKEGTYTLIVTDAAFNETVVTFTIDKTAPEVIINDKVIEATDETLYFAKEATFVIDENNLDSFTTNGHDRTENVLAGQWTASYDGFYEIVVTDKAGNSTALKIVVDTTAPVINLYADNKDELVSGVTTTKEVKVLIDEKNDYTAVLTKNDEEIEFNEDTFYGRGNYVLTVTDVAGNEATATFNVDKNPPAIYVNGKKYDKNTDLEYIAEDVILKLVETNLDNVKLTKNGNNVDFDTELTLTDDGKYEITATDLAGSTVTVKFIIDKTAPEVGSTDDRITDGTYHPGSVPVRVSDDNLASITVNGKEVEFEGTMWEQKFTSNGTYKIVATDEAGNSKTFTFTVDKKIPLLVINNEIVEATDEILYYNNDVTFTVKDDNFASFTSNGHIRNEDNKGWTAGEGNYNIVITDKAGNETTYKIVVDKTKIEVNHLYTLNNSHNKMNVTDEDKYKVIGTDQDLYVEYVLKEEFTTTPILNIGGKTYEMTCKTASWNDELYKCDAHVTISTDMNLTNGEAIPFTITGVKDAAGNETVVTEEDVTNTEKYGQVIYDQKIPESVKVQIINNDNPTSSYIKNGETIRVRVTFTEALSVLPTLTIGNYSETFKNVGDGKGNDLFSADIEIPVDEITFEEGNITYTISNYEDLAGNAGEDITVTSNLIYDRTASKAGIANFYVSGVDGEKVTENGNKYVDYYATYGNKLVAYVRTTEQLSENPTFTLVYGDNKIVIQNEDVVEIPEEKDGYTYRYQAIYVIPENFEEIEKEVKVEITNIVDLAGNITTNENGENIIGISNKNRVFIDTLAPQINELRFNSSNKIDNGYANNTHSVGVYLTVHEELASDPIFIIDGKAYAKNQGSVSANGYMYAAVTKLPEDTKEGKLSFSVTVSDKVGNTVTYTENNIKNDVEGYDGVIYDVTPPKLSLVGKEETYDNILRVESGTEITLEDVYATATDANFKEDVVVEPYKATFYNNIDSGKDYDFSAGFDTKKPTGNRYHVYYKVTDYAGNTTEDVMLIVMSDTTPATITPNQEGNIHVEYGSEYTSVTATVTDNVDGIIENYKPREYIRFTSPSAADNTGEIYTNETFDTRKIGYYLAVWDYTDSSKNPSKTLKRWVIVSDTTAPDLNVSTIENGYLTSETSQIYATDLQSFDVVIKTKDGVVKRENHAKFNDALGVYTVSYKLFDDSLADGEYIIEATDISGNKSTKEFIVDRFDVIESVVSSNLINEIDNTINNFNSFAIKFDKDLVFEYGSLDKTYTISFKYSTDGINYKEADYKITNWVDSLIKDPYSDPVDRYVLSPSVTIPAESPIYWSGTNVGNRWPEIYNAILATKDISDKVYVKTIFTVVQPSYTKSFELGEVIYSNGGTDVSVRGMADFN